jgi:hypothetical protein
VSQAQPNQPKPVRLDAVGVLKPMGMRHVRPFEDELLGEFSVTRNRFFTVAQHLSRVLIGFEDCNLPVRARPAQCSSPDSGTLFTQETTPQTDPLIWSCEFSPRSDKASF